MIDLTVSYSEERLSALCSLDADCFSAEFRFGAESMRRLATAAGAIVVIAVRADETIGFSIVHLKKSRKTSGAYLVTLDVAEAWRRRGVAGRIMNEVERRAHLAGAAWMTLHVFVGNPGAIAFYESFGYVQGAIIRGFYGTGMDALVFSKQLESLRDENVEESEP